MTQKRKQYNMQFKFKVALEAAKEGKTRNQIASDYDLHPNQVSTWKKQLVEEGPSLFSRQNSRRRASQLTWEERAWQTLRAYRQK
jgi:transposase-like protein